MTQSLLTCICLTARYSIKKIQCNTVTSLQCCSLCDNLDSRYLYTCMAAERGRGGNKKRTTRRHNPKDKSVLQIHRRETHEWHTEITEQAIRSFQIGIMAQ